jgi:hypothetical protein
MNDASRLTVHPIKHVTVANFQDSSRWTGFHSRIGDVLFPLIRPKTGANYLDFGPVEFMSSARSGVLLTLAAENGESERPLVICGLRPDCVSLQAGGQSTSCSSLRYGGSGVNSFGVHTRKRDPAIKIEALVSDTDVLLSTRECNGVTVIGFNRSEIFDVEVARISNLI